MSVAAQAGPSTPLRQHSTKPTSVDQPTLSPQATDPDPAVESHVHADLVSGADLGSSAGLHSTSSPSPSLTPKVSKKQTIDQLKDGLAQMGLDTKGKKETLWRRLVNAIHRASLRDLPSDDDSDYFLDADADQTSEHADSHSPTTTSLKTNATPSPKGKGKNTSGRTSKVMKQPYNSFLCFDVEATCRPGKEFDWPNEIIEFPVVLLRWTEPDTEGKRKLEKVDHFRSYVRPSWKPVLSDFCKDLTGITQETVDASPTFPEMLKLFEKWMDKWNLRTDKGLNEAIWVTDGPWDLRDFVPKQLHITPPSPHPSYFHGPYLNLKFAVQAVLSEEHRRHSYAAERPKNPPNGRALSAITTQRLPKGEKTKSGKVKDVGKSFYFNIPGMVEALNLGGFEGRQHSGLDDATNIARILIALSEKNVIIEANGIIQPMGSGKRYPWMGQKGEVLWEDWMSFNKELGPPTSGGVREAREVMKNDEEPSGAKAIVQEKEVGTALAKLSVSEDGFVHVDGDADGLVEEAELSVRAHHPVIDPSGSPTTAVQETTEGSQMMTTATPSATAVQLAPPVETRI
ncbi:hypothetical protein I316_03796 [Kwoniella heveanensis BCC8398]|uniref:SAP domain-containing protein n=1 Tax=Kwoniella heveanensis BCC8398 TaxID=1296120 RepID=A0A1B9GTE3_9TREE|nr:hypothetical protein I316_03796 [Kwoniella heveanensis BCC8398]